MGRVLRLHDGVTRQATELDGFHDMDAFVGCSSNDDDIEHRHAKKNEHPGGVSTLTFRSNTGSNGVSSPPVARRSLRR